MSLNMRGLYRAVLKNEFKNKFEHLLFFIVTLNGGSDLSIQPSPLKNRSQSSSHHQQAVGKSFCQQILRRVP
jgi:hypothetical protein